MEPVPGIEPKLVVYKTTVLPLNYTGIGGPGRTRTYAVSYVANLQSAAFATRLTDPLL